MSLPGRLQLFLSSTTSSLIASPVKSAAINLIVRQILSKLSAGDIADPDLNDYFSEVKKHPVHYDPSKDADVQELEEEYGQDRNGGNVAVDSSDEEGISNEDSDSEPPEVSQKKGPIAKVRPVLSIVVALYS